MHYMHYIDMFQLLLLFKLLFEFSKYIKGISNGNIKYYILLHIAVIQFLQLYISLLMLV